MVGYIIKETDIHKILLRHKLTPRFIRKFPQSGQRQVFEVGLDSNKVSILKFVDVSPVIVNSQKHFVELSESEFEKERQFEIENNSKRILRELKAAKRCPIFPQLEILDGIQKYIKNDNCFLYYFETKFAGKTLNYSELYQNEQDINMVTQFLYQMIKQVKVMHEAGYVHRDITPRNIIYHEGNFKIIDAGLIKSNEEETLTVTEMRIGTPQYMAPEQERRPSNYVWDFRTDLYSIGLTAIELFLPSTRPRQKHAEHIRDLYYIFPIWKEKDNSEKSVALFTKVIARLAIEQRSKRWMNLEELITVLTTFNDKENES